MAYYETIAIIGVGLIGGSIGQAIRSRSLASRIVGIGRSEVRLKEAVRLGAVDIATTDLATGVAGADVAIVCTPVPGIAETVRLLAESGPNGLLVTDAGSTKRAIVEAVERNERARAVFVGGHPIAGSERQGVEFADPALFEGRVCAITPTDRTPIDRVRRAETFWSHLGCRILKIDPVTHDAVLALTSHLPHVVAAALASTVPTADLLLAAGAYRDGTRVAGADPALWADIFLENRMPLLDAIGKFEEQFAFFRKHLESGDRNAMIAWWDHARSSRLHYEQRGKASVED